MKLAEFHVLHVKASADRCQASLPVLVGKAPPKDLAPAKLAEAIEVAGALSKVATDPELVADLAEAQKACIEALMGKLDGVLVGS